MNLTIRNLDEDDYEAIYNLTCNELGYQKLNIEEAFRRFEAIRNREDSQTFVAVYESEVIGYIGLAKGIGYNLDGDGEYLQIIALAVKKAYQNQGIGSRLLAFAEDYARSVNINSLTVSSGFQREEAHLFYERNGYIKRSYTFNKYL